MKPSANLHASVITDALELNSGVFDSLFRGIQPEVYLWKPSSGKWCLLEILCHLCDEEKEDFRTRVRSVLEKPEVSLPPIDPEGWVKSRDYIHQDYTKKLRQFLEERKASVSWLNSLDAPPDWSNAYQHPKWGPMSAGMFLTNWLAHDYMHIRQINRLKYQYLQSHTSEILDYAGEW